MTSRRTLFGLAGAGLFGLSGCSALLDPTLHTSGAQGSASATPSTGPDAQLLQWSSRCAWFAQQQHARPQVAAMFTDHAQVLAARDRFSGAATPGMWTSPAPTPPADPSGANDQALKDYRAAAEHAEDASERMLWLSLLVATTAVRTASRQVVAGGRPRRFQAPEPTTSLQVVLAQADRLAQGLELIAGQATKALADRARARQPQLADQTQRLTQLARDRSSATPEPAWPGYDNGALPTNDAGLQGLWQKMEDGLFLALLSSAAAGVGVIDLLLEQDGHRATLGIPVRHFPGWS